MTRGGVDLPRCGETKRATIAAIGPGFPPDPAAGVFADAQANAWMTLVGVIVALAAATAGGVVGKRAPTPQGETRRR